PEQVRGKELDSRTDLFSFGVVLFEMATASLPFRGETSGVIFDGILNRAPTAAVRLNPDISLKLEDIINRALEKDRNLRYQHAADIRAELQRLKRDTESARMVVVGRPEEKQVASLEKQQSTKQSGTVSSVTSALLQRVGSSPWCKWLLAGSAFFVIVTAAILSNVGESRDRLLWNIYRFRERLLTNRDVNKVKLVAGLPTLNEGKYVAVLPFRVLGDRSSLGYVADGIAEALSAKLFGLSTLHVVANPSSKETDLTQPLEHLARSFGVNL